MSWSPCKGIQVQKVTGTERVAGRTYMRVGNQHLLFMRMVERVVGFGAVPSKQATLLSRHPYYTEQVYGCILSKRPSIFLRDIYRSIELCLL